MTSNLLGKKAIAVWFAIAAMVGAGAFAVVPTVPNECITEADCDLPAAINDPNRRVPQLIGDNIDSSGVVGTTNTFQWEEDCVITEITAVFTEVLTECTQHTVVIRITADEGDRGTYRIEDLLCFADSPDQAARITANVDNDLLVDINDAVLAGGDGVETIRITSSPNEWIVNVPNCSDTGDENDFFFDIIVLGEGEFRFAISIEPL